MVSGGIRRAASAALVLACVLVYPAASAAQQRTATGFYYPVVASFLSPCGDFLERDPAHGGCYETGFYHLGYDLPVASVGAPVYAISSGVVVGRDPGWTSDGGIALLIQHTASDGTRFIALYGHVHSPLNIGDTVAGGTRVATVGIYSTPHLHFGVIPGTTIPPGNLGKLPNSSWPSTNSFVEPMGWIASRAPNAPTVFRLSVAITGGGKIISDPAVIECGSGAVYCSADFLFGTAPALAAWPEPGWTFAGWGNACSGNSGCVALMNGPKTVTATFVPGTPVPGALAKTGPVPGGTKQSRAAVLTWSASAGAASYEYCIDTSNNGICDTSWTSTGSQTSAAPPQLVAGATYYWQVRARAGTATTAADGSLWWRFTTRSSTNPFICDIDWDGRTDLLWQRVSDGAIASLMMAGTSARDAMMFAIPPDPSWKMIGAGDFSADNSCDFLFRNSVDGRLRIWLMNGRTPIAAQAVIPAAVTDPGMTLRAVADINGDLHSDVIWQTATGANVVWLMRGTERMGEAPLPAPDPGWRIAGAADMNRDGFADLLLQHESQGGLQVWLMRGPQRDQSVTLLASFDVRWQIKAVGDLDWDGNPEVILQYSGSGALAAMIINNLVITDARYLSPSAVDSSWTLAGPR